VTDPLDDDAPRTPEDWGEAFEELRPTYSEFAERLSELLMHLVEDDEGVETYAYTVSSALERNRFVERIYDLRREGATVADPLAEFADLARVTIVTPTKHDVWAICDLVGREFDVDREASVDPAAAEARNADPAGHDRIVYDFPHSVVSLSENRRSLAEWQAYDGLRAQIDVQTELQQTWERLYESRPFTSDRYQPAAYRAALAHAAVLFRDADDQLVEVSRSLETAEEEATRAVAQDDVDLDIDAATLTAYVLKSDTLATLVRVGEDAGMAQDPYPEEVGGLEGLLWVLRWADIGTIRALDDFLGTAVPRAPEILTALASLGRDGGFTPYAEPESVLSWLILVLRRADAEIVVLSDWNGTIRDALNTVIGNDSGDGR